MPTVSKQQQQRVKKSTPKAKTPKGGTSGGRVVMHPKVTCKVHEGDKAIDVALAKKLLGWCEETKENEFGTDYMLKCDGKPIRCTNNVTNRPLLNSNVNKLKQEILRNRWRFNGEPVIIGATGLVLNGQHTLIALVMADEEYRKDPEASQLKGPPTIDKLIVYGVEETDLVVNTMDTCKPRSLSDVIYRARYFKKLPKQAQKRVARITEHAIRMLWHRTATHANAFALKQTHSESVAFLESHAKLLECVSHIYQENDTTNKITKFIPPGYAAACMFLMATSDSDPKNYFCGEDLPNQDLLDFSNWQKAEEFFVNLAAGHKGLQPVRDAIDELVANGNVSGIERVSILANAWHAYAEGTPIKPSSLVLEFEVSEDHRRLVETPLFGGIDVGEDGIALLQDDAPTPAQLEEAREKVKGTKTTSKAKSSKAKWPTKAVRKSDDWAQGDVAWMDPTPGDMTHEAHLVKVTGVPYACDDGHTRVMVTARDGEWEATFDQLRLTKFDTK